MNIIVVLVLYKKRIDESTAFKTFLDAYFNVKNEFSSIELIIYDNSPEKQNIKILKPLQFQYIHDKSNGGLATAYNYALNEGIKKGYKWLLLLDQDTTLPPNFFLLLKKVLIENSLANDVVAVIPKVFPDKGEMISPRKYIIGRLFTKTMASDFIGLCKFRVSVINSGALLRIQYLNNIGGFNMQFKLDYLDHWLFNEIYTGGKMVYVTEALVYQELSVTNFDKYLTEKRYENILKSEALFIKINASLFEKILYPLVLLLRAFELFTREQNKKYCLITLKSIFRK